MKADKLKCNVAVGGDIRQVVHMSNLTWPEVCVLRELHGDQFVTEILVTHIADINEHEAFTHMRMTYPEPVVKALYPGVSPNIKYGAPDYIERAEEAPQPAPKPRKHKAVEAESVAAESNPLDLMP